MAPRLLVLALAALASQEPAQREPASGPTLAGVELPDGRAAKVWAGVGPRTRPAELPPDTIGLLRPDAWSTGSTFERWARLLREEAAAPGADAERLAVLCLLARSQGRARDAWRHFESLSAHPRGAAAVMPFLLPGVPAHTAVEPGGVPAPLPDGVVLRPLAPPAQGKVPVGVLEWRTARIEGLRVGEAVLRLTIAVESTGVQIDIEHVSGGPARLGLVVPEPEGFEIRVEYLDWMRQDSLREPLMLEVAPGEEEPHSLFGRVLERRSAAPTGSVRRLPRQIVEGGLTLVVPPDDPQRALIEAAAASIASLLEVEVRVRASDAPRGDGWTETTVQLPEGAARADRMRYLVSAVEGFVLRPR